MPKLLIIDTFNFFHRAYHALPLSLTSPDGIPVNAVYGVASMLINIFDLLKPDYVVAALESVEKTERKKQFDAYKAHRKPMEEELKTQIPVLFEVLEGFEICTISIPGYEGDDIIGSLTKKYSTEMEVVIASNDRDLWQLVGKSVLVMSPKNNGSSADWISSREVKAKYGFGPDTVVDYKSLTGDVSDNIPGVSGIGQVTSVKLLVKYGSLENIYTNLEEIETTMGAGVARKLKEGKDSAFLSKDLAQVQIDLPLTASLKDCAFSGLNKDSVKSVLEKYAFYSLLRRLGNKYTGGEEDASKEDVAQLGLF